MKYSAHDTAIIDRGATIGDGTKIWHWSHICAGAKIGNNCSIGQNVFIGDNVSIGNNVKIQNNVSVYDSVILEDDVFCGPSMVFTNVFNPRSAFPRKSEYRTTLIKKGATLCANCTIVCGVTVGENGFIGAGAMINKDILDYSLVMGVPGKHVGWMSRFGEQIKFDHTDFGEFKCPHTGDIYKLNDGICTLTIFNGS